MGKRKKEEFLRLLERFFEKVNLVEGIWKPSKEEQRKIIAYFKRKPEDYFKILNLEEVRKSIETWDPESINLESGESEERLKAIAIYSELEKKSLYLKALVIVREPFLIFSREVTKKHCFALQDELFNLNKMYKGLISEVLIRGLLVSFIVPSGVVIECKNGLLKVSLTDVDSGCYDEDDSLEVDDLLNNDDFFYKATINIPCYRNGAKCLLERELSGILTTKFIRE
jgi:hypothetical protein